MQLMIKAKGAGILIFSTLLISIFLAKPCQAQDYAATSYKIQTIFMYNFSKYIEWPANFSESEFRIGIIGPDELIDEVQKMATAKTTSDRKFVVQNLSSPADADQLHILLISASHDNMIEAAVAQYANSPTLVVSQTTGAIDQGTCVNFLINDQGKMQYELNIATIEDKGLKIAASLISLAVNR